MQVSHSRIETFRKCPYQYKLRYIDKLTTLPTDDPQSPLILGHALHTGIECTTEAAIEEYYNAYPVITDNHVNEALKLEYWLPKIKEALPPNGIHELKIEDEDFIGFIDYLVPVGAPPIFCSKEDGTQEIRPCDGDWYDLYDFKYSNNVSSYMDSEQLHLYKYYFEKLNPNKKIRNMYFMFVPKCNLRIKYKNKTNPRDETLTEFRKRITEDLDNKKIGFVKITYDPDKVISFLTDTKHTIECEEFHKNETRLCDWCEFKNYCQEDIDYELIKKED